MEWGRGRGPGDSHKPLPGLGHFYAVQARSSKVWNSTLGVRGPVMAQGAVTFFSKKLQAPQRIYN